MNHNFCCSFEWDYPCDDCMRMHIYQMSWALVNEADILVLHVNDLKRYNKPTQAIKAYSLHHPDYPKYKQMQDWFAKEK